IRGEAAKRFGREPAEQLRILYGGSVKPDNIQGLMAETELDGVLVGGASLDPESFAKIVSAS
ncbi:MAG: triose-phosphate isomerase, partial [Acidobacteriaceae bacterium]|nr:triose-phosphate isomerase [Acidobacteriaceae bacterium]